MADAKNVVPMYRSDAMAMAAVSAAAHPRPAARVQPNV
jgi:hypothetical protein